MGCSVSKEQAGGGRKRAATKRQPSNKQRQQGTVSEEEAGRRLNKDDRVLSANNGSVFLGPDSAKGIETRLRRLSTPMVHSAKVDPSPEKQQPAIEPSLNGSTARIRRLSVVGAPPADSEAASSSDNLRQLAEEDGEYPSPRQPESPGATDSKQADSKQERQQAAAAGTGQGEGQKAAAVAKPERTRSAAFRELHEFNLMERLIGSVASLSRAGREPNYRKTNQDNCFAYQQYLHPSMALFGAFDGHGPSGHKVSAFAKKEIPILLAKQLEQEDNASKALVNTFLATQDAIIASNVDCEFSGSTSVVCFLHGSELTTAWLGDSRAVLARQEPRGLRGIQLTKDHKPANLQERNRIVKAGGRVERVMDASGKPIGPARVWLQHSWVPGLAMSRALGDAVAHSVGVSSKPDTVVTELTPQDKFLILASDGVWEFIDAQTAVELVADCPNAEQACRLLVDKAHDKWVEEEDGVVDDITAVIIKFK